MTRILSFDIGIKNLAFCELSVCEEEGEGGDGSQEGGKEEGTSQNPQNRQTPPKYVIHNWDVCDISEQGKKHDINVAIGAILDFCKNRFENHIQEIDGIVIENQPVMKNPIMKSIQMVIFTYFHMMKTHNPNLSITLTSATNKNKIVKRLPEEKAKSILQETEIEAKTNKGYKYNKKLANNVCKCFLEKYVEDTEKWTATYDKHKKKDDLADSFLQGVHMLPIPIPMPIPLSLI